MYTYILNNIRWYNVSKTTTIYFIFFFLRPRYSLYNYCTMLRYYWLLLDERMRGKKNADNNCCGYILNRHQRRYNNNQITIRYRVTHRKTFTSVTLLQNALYLYPPTIYTLERRRALTHCLNTSVLTYKTCRWKQTSLRS